MSIANVQPLFTDERVYDTRNRDDFIAAAHLGKTLLHPSLSILRRSDEELVDLRGAYQKLRTARSLNSSVDFETSVRFQNGELQVSFPEGLSLLDQEIARILKDDLLKTARLYADATQTTGRFLLKPSTVIDADTHIHHVPVLSISWGGAGLAIDKDGKQTAQIEEGDFGLLSPRMPHRSPYRSAPGRLVMFVAPPPER